MSCRRICRELIWQARFGELGPGSAPHLEHLTDCRACRDELGFDRALVRQLRTALAERVEGAAPSPRAWEGVLARMARPDQPPSRRRAWSATLVAQLRFGSAMAGATLAFVLALNVEVVAVRPSDGSAGGTIQSAPPPRPLTLADGFPQAAPSAPYAVVPDEAPEPPEARPTVVIGSVPEPEQLPLRSPLDTGTAAPPSEDGSSSSTVEAAVGWEPIIRLVPADAAAIDPEPSGGTDDDRQQAPAPPATPPSGAPS